MRKLEFSHEKAGILSSESSKSFMRKLKFPFQTTVILSLEIWNSFQKAGIITTKTRNYLIIPFPTGIISLSSWNSSQRKLE
jgi:hypothetical protein